MKLIIILVVAAAALFATLITGRWWGRNYVESLAPPPVPGQVPLDMTSQLAKPTPEWVKLYGESEQSKLYFNIAAMRAVLNQHAKVINAQKLEIQGLKKSSQSNITDAGTTKGSLPARDK